MRRISSALLALLLLFSLTACSANPQRSDPTPSSSSVHNISSSGDNSGGIIVVEGEYYYDLEHVVVYLDTFDELPVNYITKDEARSLGWTGGTPERYLEGSAIGGDRFGNREGVLPKGNYTECDLNTNGASERGAERLVFSSDGHYYYTQDHYKTFDEVWVENNEVIW